MSSVTKLKLDLYYVMTNSYTKFQVNISNTKFQVNISNTKFQVNISIDFREKSGKLKCDGQTDRQIDGQTDRRTDSEQTKSPLASW